MPTLSSLVATQVVDMTTLAANDEIYHHQSSVSLAFVRGIQWWPVNSPHKCPVTRQMFPFDDIIMNYANSRDLTSFNFVIEHGIIAWV